MKQRIFNYLLSHIVRVLVPEDIIRDSKDGKLYLGDVEVTDQELRSLTAEVKALEKMRLWSIMNETAKQLIYEKGWKTSTSMEHLNAAKTMYHILDVQQSIIRTIKKKAT